MPDPYVTGGSFKLSNGETVQWRFNRDNDAWFQWGASQEDLWATVPVLELMKNNTELFELLSQDEDS